VINLHSSQNLGDSAITEETIRQLRENFPGAHITLSMNDPSSRPEEKDISVVSSFKSWLYTIDVDRRERWRASAALWHFVSTLIALLSYRMLRRPIYLDRNPDHRRLMGAYFSADFVISCGGILLQTKRWLAISFIWIVYSMAYAVWAGKPLYMMPQSVGPLSAGYHRWLARAILGQMRVLLLRERISLKYVEALGVVGNPRYVVPDVAFGFPGVDLGEGAALLESYGLDLSSTSPKVGITLINWGAQNPHFRQQQAYESAIEQLMVHIVTGLDGYVVLLSQVVGPSHSEDDRVVARRIYERVKHLAPQVIMIEQPLSAHQIKALFAHMDLLIGTRMHSVILALSARVPTIAVAYQAKTQGTMQELGMEEWVRDIEQIEAADVTALFDRAWRARHQTRAHLEKTVPVITQRAQQAGYLIARDWTAHKSEQN
jgi:colanic acid/amylovoran biosynthesis protein